MLGLCIVTLDNHDVGEFLVDGMTALVAKTEVELEGKLRWAWTHPDAARAIGLAGADAARQTFAVDRFCRDWLALLEKVTGKP